MASKPVVFYGKQQLIDDDDDDDVVPVPIASSPLSSGAHGAPSDHASGMSSTSPPMVNFHASVASPEPAQVVTAASSATAATPERAGVNTASSTSTGSNSSTSSSNSLAAPAVHANGVNHRSPPLRMLVDGRSYGYARAPPPHRYQHQQQQQQQWPGQLRRPHWS